jgi:hypothetical protein
MKVHAVSKNLFQQRECTEGKEPDSDLAFGSTNSADELQFPDSFRIAAQPQRTSIRSAVEREAGAPGCSGCSQP